MFRSMISLCFLAALCGWPGCAGTATVSPDDLPGPGQVKIDHIRGEVIVPTRMQHPEGKPCIDDWGQRVQAFAGCSLAAGGDAKFADYFVFLAEVETEKVFEALEALGARTARHCTMAEGKNCPGLTPATKEGDYLQGDPVVLSVYWEEEGTWHERPYDSFAREKILVEGQEVVKPWTPHFVFHGSGAIHTSKTGCIACPCDCPGGIIADNRNPIYNPKPMVRFIWEGAPEVGTTVYLRIRPVMSR